MKPVEVCGGSLFETGGILGVKKKALGIYFFLLVKHTYSLCKQTAHHIACHLQYPYPAANLYTFARIGQCLYFTDRGFLKKGFMYMLIH